MWDFILGLDLGQSQDYTALCLVEEPVWVHQDAADYYGLDAGWISPSALDLDAWRFLRPDAEHAGRPSKPPLNVVHLERWQLHTPYPAIIADVLAMMRSPLLSRRNTILIVDQTGVGRPLVDSFRLAGAPLAGVTITGGFTVHTNGDELSVPKRDLISTMAMLLEQRRLEIASALPDAKTLKDELLTFRRRQTPTNGLETFEHREGRHDDLVLATALACWFREWYSTHLDFAHEEDKSRRELPPVDTRVARALAAVKRR